MRGLALTAARGSPSVRAMLTSTSRALRTASLAALVLAATLLGGCGKGGPGGPYSMKFRTIPSPAETGPVHLIFDVRDSGGHPVKAKAVDVVAKIPPRPPLPEMEVSDPASEDSPGTYGVIMSLARRGSWSIAATVRDGDKVLTSGSFTVEVR